MKKAQIVIGLGFGDEGKGITTDFLAQQNPESVVIRFSGGQQAAHTVMMDEGNIFIPALQAELSRITFLFYGTLHYSSSISVQ
jgi:adenylosuccinate synthase